MFNRDKTMTPKKLVSIIAAITVLCSATVIMSHVIQFGFGKLFQHSIRFGLTCLLAYSLINGWNAGRRIAILLMSIGGIVGVWVGINMVGKTAVAFGMLALGVIHIACVAVLLTPKVAEYFIDERNVEPVK
jgi:hypothetical protein